MKLNYFKLLDTIGNEMGIGPVHLSRSTMVDDAISTGSLVCDLIIGGGWPAGRWVALFGPEASAKSTLLYHTLGNVVRGNVNAEFFDFEGSTDPTYLNKIINLDLNKVFGTRKEGGAWEITPQCRYYQPDVGEVYLRYIHRILKMLPDKLKHNNQWYYVYDKKPKKEDFDPKLYKTTRRFWVPCDNGCAQVIWFIDSLPAMLPERQDEKDESKEIGLQARMFSRNIPLIKSRLARKRCSIVAVNQIRMKPMAFGNPEYEVGGEAPRFYCFAEDTYLQTEKGLMKGSNAYFENPEYLLGEERMEKPNLYAYMGKSDTFQITTRHGFKLKGKPGHRILALDYRSKIDWIELSEITKMCNVAIKVGANIWPKSPPILDFTFVKPKMDFSSISTTLPKKMTGELARLMGYLTADGCMKRQNSQSVITFTKSDEVVMKDFCRLFEKLFPNTSYKIVDGCNNASIKVFTLINNQIFRFLEYLGVAGKSTRCKTVPWCILQAPKNYIQEFLIGYFTCDMSIAEEKASIASTSREMLEQMQLLLLNMGIIAKKENYQSNWFSPQDERAKYGCLYFSRDQLYNLVQEIKLISIKGEIQSKIGSTNHPLCDSSIIHKRVPVLQHYYIDKGIYFDQVSDVKYDAEYVDTFDVNMPTGTIITNGIVSHNSDIRLQCRPCSNPFPGKSGQIEEEECWDSIGIDKYRYIKVATRKNKCFSPFRSSLMRIWMEEKGDIGRGIDPVFDTFQYLEETGQAERLRGGYYLIKMPGPWVGKKFRWKEIKELILNPNKAEVYSKFKFNNPDIGEIDPNNTEAQEACAQILNIREQCFQQIKSDEAFKLYFDTICGIKGDKKEAIKICSNCIRFKRHENCMDVEDEQLGCEEWLDEEAEEKQEEEQNKEELIEEPLE